MSSVELSVYVGMGNNRLRRLGRVRVRLWGDAASSLTIERQGASGDGGSRSTCPYNTVAPITRNSAFGDYHSFLGIGLPQRREPRLCRRLEFIPTAEMISPKFTSVPYQRRH